MKKISVVMSLIMVAGWANAQVAVWNPAANESSDGSWSDGANWTTETVPDAATDATFNVSGAMDCLVNDAAVAGRVRSGVDGPGGTLIVNDGGSLTVGAVDWTAIGYNNTSEMVVESGGSASFEHHLWIGFTGGGDGTLTMNGGTVSVSQMTGLGWSGGKGTANINGGTLNLAQFHPENSIKGQSVLNIGAGTVVITGDHLDVVNTYITGGKITGYGGGGTILVDFDTTNSGATTITAEEGEEPPAQVAWDPANNPSESQGTWAEDGNWTGGRRPGNTTRVDFNVPSAVACTVDSAASAGRVVSGEGGPGGSLIVVDGAALLVGATDYSVIGSDNTGLLQIDNGAIASFGGALRIGDSTGADGVMTMNGGTVSVFGLFGLGSNGGNGTANINGGTLSLADPGLTDWIKGNSVLDVAGAAKVVITSYHIDSVEDYVNSGKITANGGNNVFYSYDPGADETTISAEYIPPVQTVWEPNAIASSDGLWNSDANWTDGRPGNITKVVFNVPGSIDCTVTGVASAGRVVLGDGAAGGNLTVANGGNLTIGALDWTAIGWTATSELVVEEDGSVTTGHHVWIGHNAGAEGTLTMTGGTFSVGQMIGLGWSGGKGTANITGGTLNLAQLHADNSIKGESVMDVSGTGKVVITGNKYDAIANYVATGKIKSNGGANVIFYYDSGADTTVINGMMPAEVPPHQLTDTDVNLEGGEMTLTFRTIIGQTYHVESTASLSPANWTTVSGTTVTATEPWTTFTLPIGSSGDLFYQSALD